MLHYLTPAAGEVIVDATVGAGGHARLIGEHRPRGRLIGLDRDESMLDLARPRLTGLARRRCFTRNFDRLRDALDELGVAAVDGVLSNTLSRRRRRAAQEQWLRIAVVHSKAAENLEVLGGGFAFAGHGVELDFAGFAVAGLDGVYDAGAGVGADGEAVD